MPGGIHTASPAAFAAVIAWLNAVVESFAPVGSAPSVVTETVLAGWVTAAGTL